MSFVKPNYRQKYNKGFGKKKKKKSKGLYLAGQGLSIAGGKKKKKKTEWMKLVDRVQKKLGVSRRQAMIEAKKIYRQ
jgi:hypothetical protein